jgi:hypothetical protein
MDSRHSEISNLRSVLYTEALTLTAEESKKSKPKFDNDDDDVPEITYDGIKEKEQERKFWESQ